MADVRTTIRDVLAQRGVVAIIGLALLVMTGFGIVLPILPLYGRSFGVGYGTASLLLAAYGVARLAADLVAGPLVDRVGERRAGAAGSALTAALSLAASLAPTFPIAVACWGAAGAGAAVMIASFYSYLLRVVPKERMARTLGLFYGAFNAGIIAGSPVGGVLAHELGLRSPLAAYAAVLAVAALVYLRFVPEPERPRVEPPLTPEEAERERAAPVPRAGRTSLRALLRIPGFATVLLLNLAYMWIIAAVFDTLIPFFARDELGLSTLALGALFAVSLAAEFAVLYPAGSAADRHGRRVVLVPSFVALAAAVALLGLAPTVLLFGIGLAVLGVAAGYAGVPPGAMLSDVTPEGSSGTAVGAFRFSGDLGFVVGPPLAGYAANGLGFEAAFAIAALPAAVAALAAARTRETLRPARAGAAR